MGRVVADRLLRSLQSDNQLSVRYFLEWAVVMVMVKYPASLEMLYQLLEEVSEGVGRGGGQEGGRRWTKKRGMGHECEGRRRGRGQG